MNSCIVRESNPGRPRGRRAFYHWTNDAFATVLQELHDKTRLCWCCVKGQGLGLFSCVKVRIFESKEWRLGSRERCWKKEILPGGESNPGLPRDRRGYLPLYYRGFDEEDPDFCRLVVSTSKNASKRKVPGKWKQPTWNLVESNDYWTQKQGPRKKKSPSSRIWTSDLWISALQYLLQSTALPTELSKDDWNEGSSKHIL